MDQRGYTYLIVLFAVAIMGIVLAKTSIIWHQASQRDKEVDLLFIGNEFRSAIAVYYQRSPGAIKRFPENLEQLLRDDRYVSTQRHLRRIYRDPMTGNADWELIQAPQGGIMGVRSKSAVKPIKTSNFSAADSKFDGAQSYREWQFAYEPPSEAVPIQNLPREQNSPRPPTARLQGTITLDDLKRDK